MDRLSFEDVVRIASDTPDLISQYDRLFGTNLSLRGSGLDLMIDEATGRLREDVRGFISFCWDCLWMPVWIAERERGE